MPPSTSPLGRLRNGALNLLVSRVVFRRAQRTAQAHLRQLDVDPLPVFVLDGPSLADRLLQLTSKGFEYPRSDLRASVTFVGPVLPVRGPFEPPAWWTDLNEGRPVVHVTQGTIANIDLHKLIIPAMRALADRDLLLVVTTGDEASATALQATAPENVRVEAFLPYDQLLRKVDVMITNGGYGGVQFALANGVPMVVAGDTEEKPEIAARVAWSGAGINLRTGSPSEHAIGDAVHRVLTEPGFLSAAHRLRDELAGLAPMRDITEAMDYFVRAASPIGSRHGMHPAG
jgi:UDP:flavonoid glycosyltransferase YjiC (YdhE family)